MEENLRKLTEGKRIILVGNSVEILQHQLADYIESFDTVVRFGNGIPDETCQNYEVTKLCTVYVCTCVCTPQARNGECKPLGVCETCAPSSGVSVVVSRNKL